MTSRPREVVSPRRRPANPIGGSARRQDDQMSEMSPGSEAMSRFEMFVPTAYVVPQESTAVVEAVVAPSAENARPSAPSATELLSSENR